MLIPNVVGVDFAMVEPPQINYNAGQYVILHTTGPNGNVVKRSYSISSPPAAAGFSLCVKIVGDASQYIADLKPGDPVKFSGPWGMGKFTFPEKTENEIVMIATGTGLSPIYSLLSGNLSAHPDKRFLFLWGLKKESDIFYTKELEDLAQKYLNFAFRIVLSEAGSAWTGKRGMLSDVFAAEIGDLGGKEYFLAGN